MVGYASDTGEFRGSIHQVSGQMFLDSLSPARVQVTVPITPRGLMPERAAVREPMDDRPLEARRVSSMTLAAREFQPLTRANGAGGEGIMAGTLQLDGVERPVRIPISFAVDGPMLQGQGQFDVNLADFDATPPGRQLDCRDDITMEVFLIATTQ
jgi:polyisoprenoid-binding protein YceI